MVTKRLLVRILFVEADVPDFEILSGIPVNNAAVFTGKNGQYWLKAASRIEARAPASLPRAVRFSLFGAAILRFSAQRCTVG